MCAMHSMRLYRHGDTSTVKPAGRDMRGAPIHYVTMHVWLRRDRGLASTHPCVDCGKQGHQWSYDNADPEELTWEGHNYSLDPDRYAARCMSCHVRFDHADRHVRASVKSL